MHKLGARMNELNLIKAVPDGAFKPQKKVAAENFRETGLISKPFWPKPVVIKPRHRKPNAMKHDQELRDQLTKLLQGGIAYQPIGELLKGITAEEAGKTVPHLPYTIWRLLEHMRLTLNDILEFCQNPNYKYLDWPDDYW